MLVDPEAALAAHGAGAGSAITIALGGKSGIPGDAPFEAEFRVEQVGDGRVLGTGPMYGGARMNLGPMASLRIRDIQILVGSRKAQLADQAMYRHCGIEPTTRKIIVNKSSVHFRADFEPIASEVLICVSRRGRWSRTRERFPGRAFAPGCAFARTAPPSPPPDPRRRSGVRAAVSGVRVRLHSLTMVIVGFRSRARLPGLVAALPLTPEGPVEWTQSTA